MMDAEASIYNMLREQHILTRQQLRQLDADMKAVRFENRHERLIFHGGRIKEIITGSVDCILDRMRKQLDPDVFEAIGEPLIVLRCDYLDKYVPEDFVTEATLEYATRDTWEAFTRAIQQTTSLLT